MVLCFGSSLGQNLVILCGLLSHGYPYVDSRPLLVWAQNTCDLNIWKGYTELLFPDDVVFFKIKKNNETNYEKIEKSHEKQWKQ